GFAAHGYDLVIAANVLHATRDIGASLGHCRRLLAPSGILVALEGLKPQGWLDLTFGLLEGWWRFEDRWRADHALMGASSWRSVLPDAGFDGVEVIAADGAMAEDASQGVIVAQAPSVVEEPRGLWLVLAPGDGGHVLATGLAARNQQVIWVDPAGGVAEKPLLPGVRQAFVEPARRDAWQALLAALSDDVPLDGVVHGEALGGAGTELWPDTERLTASALALSQALQEAGQFPRKGMSFLTRRAIVTGQEPAPGLPGAPLWGFARSLAQEVPQLAPRLIDLDAQNAAEGAEPLPPSLINILLDPDNETETAFRNNTRLASRRKVLRSENGIRGVSFELCWPVVRQVEVNSDLAGLVKPRRMIVLTSGPDQVADHLADALRKAGHAVETCATGSPGHWIGEAERDGRLGALEELSGITWVVPQSKGICSVDVVLPPALVNTLLLIQSVEASRLRLPLGVSIVTQGAVAADAGEPCDPVAASIWGLVRSLQNEVPDLGLRLVDVSGAGMDVLARVLGEEGPEAQLALRGSRLMAPRLDRARQVPASQHDVSIAGSASY
ncbi:MAG: hypothetical protein WCJ41_22110, partial [Aestuariivirga sp.]|uniref:hypothetical protein n=1 Tax=Aestuariivirga sp. TaxID=2650926 RepID=UPI0030177D75